MSYLHIGLICLMFSFSAHAQRFIQVPVFDLKATEFVDTWELVTGLEDKKIELDCTSFLNGLNFYQLKSSGEKELLEGIFLYHHECKELGDRIYQLTSREQPLCLKSYPEIPDFEISKDWKHCPAGLSRAK